MTSPLEARLLLRLQDSLDEEQRGSCLAELACYYARVGEFEEAERLRRDLRANFSDARSPSVSISIMIMEALLLYFKDLNPLARDRMLRANLLSKSFGEMRLYALTSAWLAHIDFNQGRFDSMAASIEAAFSFMSHDDGSAKCRASVVLGDVFAYCGQLAVSRYWYEQARRCAIDLGDQATIGALIYNRAALHVASLRLNCISGVGDRGEVALARAEVQSAINYQHVAKLKSLGHLLQSAAIGAAILEFRYEDALGLLDALLVEGEVPGSSTEGIIHLADRAMCLAGVGRLDEARILARRVRSMQFDALPADDEALLFDSLANVFDRFGELTEVARLRERALVALSRHRTHIGAILVMIEKYAQFFDPKA